MTQLPQETTVTVNGVTYKLSKFTIPLYQEFVTWAKGKLPDPFDGIAERVKGLSPEIAKYIIDKAEAKAAKRGTLNDPEIEALASTPEGMAKMLSLLFRKYQPSMTEAEVMDVIEKGVAEHGEDFLAGAFPEKPGAVPAG